MNTIDKMIRKQNFSDLKKTLGNEFESTPSEEITDQDGVYQRTFQTYIPDTIFENVQLVLLFRYNTKPTPFLMVNLEVWVDGIHEGVNDDYFIWKNKERFVNVIRQVDEILIDWHHQKQSRFCIYNQITEKMARNKMYGEEREQFLKLENQLLVLVQKPWVKAKNKEAEIMLTQKNAETENLFKTLEKINWENAVNKAIQEKDFQMLKKLSGMKMN